MANPDKAMLTDLLQQVSRSFYLTLRVLPRPVRPQIGLAYLLARATDTIADTGIVSLQQRLSALAALRGRILGQSQDALDFGALAEHQGSPAERVLLERIEDALALLRTLSKEDLARVRQVIDTITSGQELDLRRFGQAPSATAAAAPPLPHLEMDADLDDYTYRVAGCVGEFWTRMCRAHLFPDAQLDDRQLIANGIRFGQGLQLVNILRDLPRDLQQGRCYIPADLLRPAGLTPDDLLSPQNEPRFRPVYDALLQRAEGHLVAGWAYTNALPRSQWRVRLACAWPILIGRRTVELLRHGQVLDPATRIKVARAEVQEMMLRSLLLVPFPTVFRDLWPAPGESC